MKTGRSVKSGQYNMIMNDNELRVQEKEMLEVLEKLFLKYGFTAEKAGLLARTYTDSTLAGVQSHGINRVPLFLDYVNKGLVNPDAEAVCSGESGNMERWDGKSGPGIINAVICTDRAIELAKEHGMGLVALRHTNHWMRGGTYGLRAADAGCMALLFTNTLPNMPPWGGKDSRIGNNPLVISIPREKGHVVLDMAVSQFSFGKINEYRLREEKLPVYGGWDTEGRLSDDPAKILEKERGLPVGYWKGSALSMILDMLATLLSAGNSTYRIGQKDHETGISQVYLCLQPAAFGDGALQANLLNEIIDYTRDVEPMHPGNRTYYPGERSAMNRERNLREGIPVNGSVWKEVIGLSI